LLLRARAADTTAADVQNVVRDLVHYPDFSVDLPMASVEHGIALATVIERC